MLVAASSPTSEDGAPEFARIDLRRLVWQRPAIATGPRQIHTEMMQLRRPGLR